MSSSVPFPVALRALGLLWLFSALAVGKLQLLQQLPAPLIPVLVLGLTLLLLAAHHVSSTLRAWVDGLDLRALVMLHVTRLVGIYFLMLEARGGLPAEFFQAGVGDIAVALLALVVVLVPLSPARRLRAVTIWNVIGLVDLLLVIFSAGRLALTQPLAMRPFSELPLSLMPTLLAPLLIVTHIIIFMRIKRLTGAGRGQ